MIELASGMPKAVEFQDIPPDAEATYQKEFWMNLGEVGCGRFVCDALWLSVYPLEFALGKGARQLITVTVSPDTDQVAAAHPAEAQLVFEWTPLGAGAIPAGVPPSTTIPVRLTFQHIPDPRYQCPACTYENRPGSLYCHNSDCLTPYKTCATCDSLNLITAAACRTDGAPLPPQRDGDQWRVLFGNPAHSHRSHWKLGRTFELAWHFSSASPKREDRIHWSSAVCAFGMVFVAGLSHNDADLYAFDGDTGARLWQSPLPDEQPLHPARSGPAVIGDRIYVATVRGCMAAYDLHGSMLWSERVGSKIYGAPNALGDRIVVATTVTPQHGKIAIFTKDGEFVQDFDTTGALDSTPAVWGGMVLIGCDDGTFYAFDSGQQGRSWTCPGLGDFDASPIVSRGVVYTVTAHGMAYALDAFTGAIKWMQPLSSATTFEATPVVVSDPVTKEELVWFSGNDGQVRVLSKAGVLVGSITVGGHIRSTPAVSADIIAFGTDDGFLHIRDAGRREIFPYRAEDHSRIETSPAIANAMIYFGSTNGTFYALRGTEAALQKEQR